MASQDADGSAGVRESIGVRREGFVVGRNGVPCRFMKQRNKSGRNRLRTAAGVLCLLAVSLMQAPLVLAAWSISTGKCCTGSYCPIAAHHHRQMESEPAHEMDCGHEMSGMSSCKISCCHDSDQPTIAANVFLVPVGSSFEEPISSVATIEATKPTKFQRFIDPQFPPPRITSSIL